MSLLKNIVIKSSSISAICGILTYKDKPCTYTNVGFNRKLYGTGADYVLDNPDGILKHVKLDETSSDQPTKLNGVFVIKHMTGLVDGNSCVIGVKDNVILCVADNKGLIWTHPTHSTMTIQDECLKEVMTPDGFEQYKLGRKRRFSDDLAFF